MLPMPNQSANHHSMPNLEANHGFDGVEQGDGYLEPVAASDNAFWAITCDFSAIVVKPGRCFRNAQYQVGAVGSPVRP
jgi:hypothetical protein